ncbi:MAG: formate dehydrogenase accessory sulfurtransferase FdhD [Verrucomicrobiota bacterium]
MSLEVTKETPLRTSVRVIKQRMQGTEMSAPELDELAIEDPIEIVLFYNSGQLNRKSRVLTLTMRTPGNDEEMITGFLFCEGIIQSSDDIDTIKFSEPADAEAPTRAIVNLREGLQVSDEVFDRNLSIHSSCGICGKNSLNRLGISPKLALTNFSQIDYMLVHQLPKRMHQAQTVFHKTGGLHAAAIFSDDYKNVVSREDIGRHNAMDKAIGAKLRSGGARELGQAVCVSGRMSYEIIQKALVARIPIVAGVGAPSSLAVALANDFNLTMIGFIREGCYSVYSNPERIRTSNRTL